jgi:hypothetical protein
MRVIAEFLKTEDYPLKLTCTMSLGEWKAIAQRMSNEWPSWQFGAHITDAVARAERTVFSDPPKET